MQTLLYRNDGNGFDEVEWAFAKTDLPHSSVVNSAVMYGNEDAPIRIEFYCELEPLINSIPFAVWNEKAAHNA